MLPRRGVLLPCTRLQSLPACVHRLRQHRKEKCIGLLSHSSYWGQRRRRAPTSCPRRTSRRTGSCTARTTAARAPTGTRSAGATRPGRRRSRLRPSGPWLPGRGRATQIATRVATQPATRGRSPRARPNRDTQGHNTRPPGVLSHLLGSLRSSCVLIRFPSDYLHDWIRRALARQTRKSPKTVAATRHHKQGNIEEN